MTCATTREDIVALNFQLREKIAALEADLINSNGALLAATQRIKLLDHALQALEIKNDRLRTQLREATFESRED